MFIPRQLIKKKSKPIQPSKDARERVGEQTEKLRVTLPTRNSVTETLPKAEVATTVETPKHSNPRAAKEIVLALELLLGSVNRHTGWLEKRMRTLEGYDNFIHLSALLPCWFFETFKKVPSQIDLRDALASVSSEILQTSSDGYYVRHTLPTPLVIKDEWTLYVEPAFTHEFTHPGHIAGLLVDHLPQKFLPVRYVECGKGLWAFVSLSWSITDEETVQEDLWPPGWKVLTKAEWKRRDETYRKLQSGWRPPREPRTVVERPPRQMVEERPSPPVTTTKSTNLDYQPGLIIHLTNVHPLATKPILSSFIVRSVDRYRRKKASKMKESNTDDIANHPIKLHYIEHQKESDEAYTRQGSEEDSQLIVKALKKRKRCMRDGNDGRGRKAVKGNTAWIAGRILEGDEESTYWQRVNNSKRKATERSTVSLDIRKRPKRERASTSSGHEEITGKRSRTHDP